MLTGKPRGSLFEDIACVHQARSAGCHDQVADFHVGKRVFVMINKEGKKERDKTKRWERDPVSC